jgi:hypothetical protein
MVDMTLGKCKTSEDAAFRLEGSLGRFAGETKLEDADETCAEGVYRNIQSSKGSRADGLAMTLSVFAAA